MTSIPELMNLADDCIKQQNVIIDKLNYLFEMCEVPLPPEQGVENTKSSDGASGVLNRHESSLVYLASQQNASISLIDIISKALMGHAQSQEQGGVNVAGPRTSEAMREIGEIK